MTTRQPAAPVFHQGDKVYLAQGTYQGTPGTFLQLCEDPRWADIAQRDGRIRSHPLVWLAHAPSPAAAAESNPHV